MAAETFYLRGEPATSERMITKHDIVPIITCTRGGILLGNYATCTQVCMSNLLQIYVLFS